MRFEDYIEIRPGVRAGKPCFKGTRITVYDVLEYLAGEMTEDELLHDFPELTPQSHQRRKGLFTCSTITASDRFYRLILFL